MKFTFKIGQKIKEAWPLYKENLGLFLLLTLITLVASSINQSGDNPNTLLSIVMMFVNFLISSIWILSVLDLIDNKRFKPFSRKSFPSLKQYWYFISTSFLISLAIIIGFALLVVPGIYLVGRLMFAPYIALDKNKNAIDSIRDCWHMTKDHGWKIFGKNFIIGLFILAGFLALILGLFITYPIGTILLVMLYREFEKFKKNNINENI